MRKGIAIAVCLGALSMLVLPATAGAVPRGSVLLADATSFELRTNPGPPVSYTLLAPHAYTGVTQGEVVNGEGYELCSGDVSLASTDGATSTYTGSLRCWWDDRSELPHAVPPTQGTIPNVYSDSVVLTVGPTTWSMSGAIGDWSSGPTESCQGAVQPPDPAYPQATDVVGECTLTD